MYLNRRWLEGSNGVPSLHTANMQLQRCCKQKNEICPLSFVFFCPVHSSSSSVRCTYTITSLFFSSVHSTHIQQPHSNRIDALYRTVYVLKFKCEDLCPQRRVTLGPNGQKPRIWAYTSEHRMQSGI